MIVVGTGVAGLMAALAAAPRPVTLIAPSPFEKKQAASWFSQGGLAAAIGEDDDTSLHITDTLAAGAGLCNADALARIINKGPWAVEKLLSLGVKFDRDPDGKLSLGLEAAHSKKRILHGGGDKTGAVIMRALVERVKACESISILDACVERVLVGDGGVEGIQCQKDGIAFNIADPYVLLATGGIGGLFKYSTNPAGSIGHGLTLAIEAGSILKDIEFIQFHPTALAVDQMPLPLVSEAVRGEGARLVDETGCYFMQGQDLAPRDVVARAVFERISQGHKVFLDVSDFKDRFHTRFPTIEAACLKYGIDPKNKPIPVQPAAHYHMGGILVDQFGRTSVDGLYAAGEVACTGLHGANRLASNSLLEAVICGWQTGFFMALQEARAVKIWSDLALPAFARPESVREVMTDYCGVVRSSAGLSYAAETLSALKTSNPSAKLALKIVEAALSRKESVGAHMRVESLLEKLSSNV